MGLKIEYLEEEIPVYDITVDDNHNFFANDLLVHNCQEITLPTGPLEHIDDEHGEIALCILSAINVGVIRQLDDLEELCDLAVRALEEIIDYQCYPVMAAEISTKARRSLGIGYIGLAHYLAKNHAKYEDPKSWQLVHDLSEAFQYYLLKASNKLAKERGACSDFDRTKYADGILPIDTYKKDIDDVVPNNLNYDWEALRKDIAEHGLRHSTLSAQMPSESCLKWDHKVQTTDGELNFHEICEANEIDWGSIESNDAIGWYNLENPISVPTLDGTKEVSKLYYNGTKEVISLTLEDGKIFKCTASHKFLVKLSDGSTEWKMAANLNEDDDIVEF